MTRINPELTFPLRSMVNGLFCVICQSQMIAICRPDNMVYFLSILRCTILLLYGCSKGCLWVAVLKLTGEGLGLGVQIHGLHSAGGGVL